ncbi:hypothetical protein TNIN_301301 [Trichonephila inaurata madagascariensis]|uniref:Maf-like protein n=1 Tax=Trichonephila inaurata madagascariensis TaxID=2747483 RepID=A0A8X6YJ93_9ARAC|nr:hypothetical protein TNIN_301301 [Trichonephila inaurata madagascariensis]
MLAPYSSRLSNMKVVLASTSPRRKQILEEQLGMQFEIVDPCFDEDLTPIDILTPHEYVEENAMQKALSVAKDYIFSEMEVPLLIIGADTIVVMNNDILGKPESVAHNVAMLKRLNGKNHDVLTGVTLVYGVEDDFREPREYKMKIFSEKTTVKMGYLPHNVMLEYVKSGEPQSKAGGYAIQNRGGTLIEGIDGDYYNVVGLPAHRVAREIRDLLEANLL